MPTAEEPARCSCSGTSSWVTPPQTTIATTAATTPGRSRATAGSSRHGGRRGAPAAATRACGTSARATVSTALTPPRSTNGAPTPACWASTPDSSGPTVDPAAELVTIVPTPPRQEPAGPSCPPAPTGAHSWANQAGQVVHNAP